MAIRMPTDRVLRAVVRATAATRRCRRIHQLMRPTRVFLSTDSRSPAPPAASALDGNVDGKNVNMQLPTSALLLPSSNPAWQVVRPEHFRHIAAPADWDARLSALQTRIGVRFKDVTLLKCALTHSGAFQLNALPADAPAHRLANRSLEFLGDSVLGLAAASVVFQGQPRDQEGQLTVAKSALVNNQVLSRICERHLEMHELILVAQDYSLQRRSLKPKYSRGRDTIQAGAVESLIAAIYLDQGLEAALGFVNTHVLPHAEALAREKPVWEPISALQILLQAHQGSHPTYKHLPKPVASDTFQVALVVKGETILTASGASYKAARTAAAEAGYAHFAPLLSSADA